VVRVPLVVREGFSGGTRAAFLSYSKSFVNSFLCYNSLVCYANVANSFLSYINLKYIWANYVLLKPRGVHSNLKKTSGGTRSHKVWDPLLYRDKGITIIRLWWLSQWLVTHGHHLEVTNYLHVAPSSGRHITSLSISLTFYHLSSIPVMETRDLVSVSRCVSIPVFWSLESLRSRLGFKGFRSRSRALRLETLHRFFLMKFCKEFLKKMVLKNDCSKFRRSKRSVAKLSLLLCCLRDGETIVLYPV